MKGIITIYLSQYPKYKNLELLKIIKLKELNLNGNEITKIFKEISQLTGLEHLDFGNNKFLYRNIRIYTLVSFGDNNFGNLSLKFEEKELDFQRAKIELIDKDKAIKLKNNKIKELEDENEKLKNELDKLQEFKTCLMLIKNVTND